MTRGVRKQLKLAIVAVLFFGTVMTVGILHSLSGYVQSEESQIIAEEVHDKEILKDVQLIKRLMQRAAEFVSFTTPI